MNVYKQLLKLTYFYYRRIAFWKLESEATKFQEWLRKRQ